MTICCGTCCAYLACIFSSHPCVTWWRWMQAQLRVTQLVSKWVNQSNPERPACLHHLFAHETPTHSSFCDLASIPYLMHLQTPSTLTLRCEPNLGPFPITTNTNLSPSPVVCGLDQGRILLLIHCLHPWLFMVPPHTCHRILLKQKPNPPHSCSGSSFTSKTPSEPGAGLYHDLQGSVCPWIHVLAPCPFLSSLSLLPSFSCITPLLATPEADQTGSTSRPLYSWFSLRGKLFTRSPSGSLVLITPTLSLP